MSTCLKIVPYLNCPQSFICCAVHYWIKPVVPLLSTFFSFKSLLLWWSKRPSEILFKEDDVPFNDGSSSGRRLFHLQSWSFFFVFPSGEPGSKWALTVSETEAGRGKGQKGCHFAKGSSSFLLLLLPSPFWQTRFSNGIDGEKRGESQPFSSSICHRRWAQERRKERERASFRQRRKTLAKKCSDDVEMSLTFAFDKSNRGRKV